MQPSREQVAQIARSIMSLSLAGRIALAILGAALCAAGIGSIIAAFATHPEYPANTDLWIYMRAADAVTTNPYDATVNTGFDRYGYPPLLAGVMAALTAMFGADLVLWIWPAACIGAIAAAIVMLSRSFGVKLPWSVILIAIGIVLMGRVVRSDVLQGQVNMFILLLLTSGLMLRSRGKIIAAAAVFAVMMSLKPFMGAVVIYYAMRGDWRTTRWSLGLGAAVFFASFLPMGLNALDAFAGWRQATEYFTSAPFATKPDNQSAYGLALRMFTETPHSTPWINLPSLVPAFMAGAITLAALLAITGLHLDKRPHRPKRMPAPAVQLLECSMIIALGGFCGPLTEGNHMVITLAGFAAATIVGANRLRRGSAQSRLWVATMTAWTIPVMFVVFPRILPMAYGIYPFWYGIDGWEILLTGRGGLLLLLAGGFTAITLWQERRTVTSAVAPGRIQLATGWRRQA